MIYQTSLEVLRKESDKMRNFKPVVIPFILAAYLALHGCGSGDVSKKVGSLDSAEIIAESDSKKESIKDLFKLANENVGSAQGKLAQEFYDGLYIKANDTKALYWAEKAYKNKDSLGTLLLARMTFYGEGTDKNPTQAIKLMESIVTERIEAGYILGKMYFDLSDQNPEYALKGAELISKSAENGFPIAQYEHAQTLLIGSKEPNQNLDPKLRLSIQKNAVGFMSMAADQEYIPAVRDMGLFYLNGYIVDKDINQGKSLLELASRNGDQAAISCLTENNCDLGVYK